MLLGVQFWLSLMCGQPSKLKAERWENNDGSNAVRCPALVFAARGPLAQMGSESVQLEFLTVRATRKAQLSFWAENSLFNGNCKPSICRDLGLSPRNNLAEDHSNESHDPLC